MEHSSFCTALWGDFAIKWKYLDGEVCFTFEKSNQEKGTIVSSFLKVL